MGMMFVQPFKDLLKSELAFYFHMRKLKQLNPLTLTDLTQKQKSINLLTEDFILKLQTDFNHTGMRGETLQRTQKEKTKKKPKNIYIKNQKKKPKTSPLVLVHTLLRSADKLSSSGGGAAPKGKAARKAADGSSAPAAFKSTGPVCAMCL